MASLEKVKISLTMKASDRKILNDLLIENNDDAVRRKLVSKYNISYRYW